MIKKEVLIAFVLLFSLVNYAQEIHLQIIDVDTKAPLPLAVFRYGSSLDKLIDYKIANNNGHLIIKQPELTCYYEISSLGYITRRGFLKKNTHIITLKENPIQIDEVVIKADASKPIKKSVVRTQMVTAKDLVNAGYANLQQVLIQETPGMNIQKVGFGNDMNMQGLDARHILFLIDGERLTGEMAGNLDYERFNLHAIKRVEIIKGASSTLYGSRAAGAVINLITKKTSEPFKISVGTRYTQFNERNYKDPKPKDFLYMFEKNSDRPNIKSWLSLGFNKKMITSQTDVLYNSTDAFKMYQYGNDVKRYLASTNTFLKKDSIVVSSLSRPPMGISGPESISIAQKIYVEPSDNFSVQLYGTYFFMNNYDLIQDLYFTQSEDITSGVKLKWNWKNYLSSKVVFHTDFYKRYKRHERRDIRQKVYNSRIYQPRLILKSNYLKKHELIAGIDYFRDDLTSDRFVNQKMTTRSLKEWEFYAQDKYTINDKLTAETGFRSTYSIPFGIMFLPKVAFQYSLAKKWNLRANYSKGFRSPSIKELFFNWDHLGMFQIIGDEKLQPESNNYYAFGVDYDNKKLFISSNIYGNYFYDKIEGIWKVYNFQYNFEYMNLKKQRLLGTDFLLRWKINDTFMLNTSYSYVDVEDTHGVRFNTTSPHALTAGLSYKYSKPNYDLRATISTSFTGSKEFDVQDRLTITEKIMNNKGVYVDVTTSKEAFFRTELPSYFMCNININQTFSDHIKVSCGVNNVFNYIPETLGSGVTLFNIPATAGARGFIELEYKF